MKVVLTDTDLAILQEAEWEEYLLAQQFDATGASKLHGLIERVLARNEVKS